MSSGKVVLGALAGLAAGAVLGILLAPDKGSNTRKKMTDKAGSYADDLKEKFNDFVEGITEKFEAAKEDANDFVETGKAKVQSVKKEFKNGLSEKISANPDF